METKTYFSHPVSATIAYSQLPSGNVAYLGPAGSFTHQAADVYFGSEVEHVAKASIRSVFESVEADEVCYGVVPIENNQEGTVLDTIDLLYEKDLHIVAETQLAIQFSLATQASALTEISQIYSKDIAFRQCSHFLRTLTGYPIELIAIESTSKAAILASESRSAAALCSPIAAKEYGVPILFDNIGDSSQNCTRFLILAKDYQPGPCGFDKTTIIAQLPNTNTPGVLACFLQEFSAQQINLTKIESRPLRQGYTFQYWFLIEFDGHIAEASVQQIMQHHLAEIKWLGSYKNSGEAFSY